ncbi:MAG: uridine diphosphate-N-acetylglucosamine-binding protein YvcK [Herpetosiphonaceae bacterium]|nr:uridine diphosphate-N-acetylglucosamine-binding protein YvcK [Herpetosiphonaceae bacterium]
MRRLSFNTKWLYPGMHVKRWLLLLFMGMTLGALGVAFGLRDLYVHGYRWPPSMYYLTLQVLPRAVRAILVGTAGLLCIVVAILRLNRSLLGALLPPRSGNQDLAELVYARRLQQRGPQVVALGGGHGLSTLLSGLKEHTEQIVAIVNVADDGGSSGRLRREFGVLPPGDIRRCLAALAASDEALMAELFEYRFDTGGGLEGHTFGNLFITALNEITGSFDQALQAASKVLAVRGRVLPPTLAPVTLAADLQVPVGSAAQVVEGESHIAKTGLPIHRVFLRPASPPAYPPAVTALLQADLIVIGPGSLYTSLLPVLLVEELRRAIIASQALVVYVCNVATEPGETDNFGVQAHLQALIDHVGARVIDVALANNNQQPANNFAPEWQGRSTIVPFDLAHTNGTSQPKMSGVPIVAADLINPANPLRHDPHKLADELMRLLRARMES